MNTLSSTPPLYSADVTFDTPHGELQDVRASFDMRGCYDWSPDYAPDAASATLAYVTLGETRMYRAELVKWIGAAMVARIEEAQLDTALEGVA